MTPPSGSEEDAAEIATHLLEATGKALLERDFSVYSELFILPQTIQTFEQRRVLYTLDDLQEVFTTVRERLARLSVTDMVRHVISAEFTSDDEILSTHETRLIFQTQQVEDAFPTHSLLRFQDGKWRVASASYAVDSTNAVYSVLSRPDADKT